MESRLLHRCVINLLGATRTVVSICVGLMLGWSVPDASALPTADEVLRELQVSDSDRQQIREGNIVTWTATEGSDRELAIGMALLVKTSAENVGKLFREATVFKTESAITAYGKTGGDGEVADFTGLKLEPNGEKEARRYLEARPGNDLNLDTKEIAAFQALKSASKDRAVPIQKVEALIREELLARYQAYHTKGLAGIRPYARKSGQHVFPRDELSLATKQSKLLAKYLPSVSDVLLNHPTTKIKDGEEFEEQFFWMNVEVFGRPTYVLSHRMHFRIGEASLVVDRHFYASHAYNSLQQGVIALPTQDGMVAIYLSRVSTDQVTGFGSSAKRSVARALMGSYQKDMLKALRAKAEKP
ncbi:MAG: hypothetical protein HZB34_03070 [Nitrospirae bacterium]|nr:hypothetical protein [Nitrospirota bacterium]